MNPTKFSKIVFSLFSLVFFMACNSPYSTKKRGYFKIQLPPHTYQSFNEPGFPYSFEYPTYAQITQDSTYFDSNPENPYWRNIDFPQFHARIFLSYKIIGGNALYKVPAGNGNYKDSLGINHFDKLINDAFMLTNKNESVASSIQDSLFKTENGVTGVYFKVGGNAATASQFFMTDTVKNFIRGALYFNVTPNADSLKPVQEFLQQDIRHLIQSFKWHTN
ncbi:MAG: hypothetical protein ABS68_03505 [Niastella sp. SCN 39-18]|nr:hypothetical protein [Sphingobacteriales bacterium]ODT54036.1 MAG: hypothetical protein ABS68_03505 [Niastella sp. SCN 39-18]OJW09807.1 MAG: hypothetical protein BGO53_08180 [Sphingobacteriales bacterium 39-19]